MKIRKKKEVNVACRKWAVCKWTGTRKVWKVERALDRPCPKCGGPVERYHEVQG